MGGNNVINQTFHLEKHVLTGVTTVAGENSLQNLTYGYNRQRIGLKEIGGCKCRSKNHTEADVKCKRIKKAYRSKIIIKLLEIRM